MRENYSLVSLNRGIVSRLGLARIDLKRLALGAETMTNWIPRVLGAMTIRPGLRYKFSTLTNQAARYLRFIFATDDTALLELTPLAMRVVIDDVLLTRPTVTAAVTNGTFAVDVTGWTDSDDVGATSAWAAPGYMELVGNGTARAMRDQQVTVNQVGTEHALRIVIARGPVTLRVGSASGGDDYVSETVLNTGTHSIAFTPTGSSFWIRFLSSRIPKVWIDSCTVEAAGVVSLPTPWTATDLQNVRYDQSADVLFVACKGYQQRRIERRGTRPGGRSWSVALYAPDNGPFRIQNTTPLSMTPSGLTGNITVTASTQYFKSTHVGALFSLTSLGQTATATATAAPTPTGSIRVTGSGDSRVFSWEITGFGTATVDVQRSYDNATWVNIGGPYSFTADNSGSLNDNLTSQIVYYRLNCSAYTGGTIVMTIRYNGGSQRGIVRVTDYTSAFVVGAEVLVPLGGTTANTVWQEGQWSDLRGWPTAGKLHEGRLWWAGLNGVWGSVSDAYDSFDETLTGDAGPINRTIGSGPVDTINWLLSMRGLLMGAQGAEIAVRSSSLDEPLTPTNFNVKTPSTQGSSAVEAIKIDQSGYFVNRSAGKVYELSFDVKGYDYTASDLMAIVPDLGSPGIVRIDVQRQPDTRIHCVRSDGTVAIAVLDKVEEVLAWVEMETDGLVEDVVVLPAASGDFDDRVYYVVRRTISGSTVRYLERWAQEGDCRGDQMFCDIADSHIRYSGAATKVITGLSHLEGKSVVVWADGSDRGTFTVASGQITLPTAVSSASVGLTYQASFKSVKIGQQTQSGSPLNQAKRITKLGFVRTDTHSQGLLFGPDFDHLDNLPLVEEGAAVSDRVDTSYDQNLIVFPGIWTTDARVCLRAGAPRPATVLAITVDLETK